MSNDTTQWHTQCNDTHNVITHTQHDDTHNTGSTSPLHTHYASTVSYRWVHGAERREHSAPGHVQQALSRYGKELELTLEFEWEWEFKEK